MIKYTFVNEELRHAVSQLEDFGFTAGEGGIPVAVKEGPRLAVSYAGGRLEIVAAKRVQIFSALKRFADAGAPEGFRYEGEPAFRNLTYMLDCSRNAVPKPETVEQLVRHLAVMGYDSLGLYLEDTFQVPAYPYFGYLRDPYSAEDLRRLDGYCAQFGVELVPYIQTLAHFNSLIRHYAMEHLFDTGDILLVGEERTYEFIDALLAFCSENFKTRSINIGMDEAYMLGRGKYLDRNGYRGRFEIMTEHLSRVLSLCKKYGFKPMMWSDMFFSLTVNGQYGDDLPADLARKIPEEVELVYWDYCSTDEAHYAENLAKHRAFRNPVGFAGAAWKWLGFTPDNRYSFACCAASARACMKAGIGRYIVTGWGDNGAECSPFATLPALLYCSRLNYGEFAIDEAFRVSFERLTQMSFDDFMTVDLNNRVTENDDVEEKNSANKYLLFNDVLLGTLDTTVSEGVGKLYSRHGTAIRAAERRAGKWAYLFETQFYLAKTLAAKADLGLRLRRAYRANDRAELAELLTVLKRLPGDVDRFYRAFKAQWERENRPCGFDVQDLRIGGLKRRLYSAIERVQAYLTGKAESVPELEAELLDHMGHGTEFEVDPDQCEWRWRRMTSVNVNE